MSGFVEKVVLDDDDRADFLRLRSSLRAEVGEHAPRRRRRAAIRFAEALPLGRLLEQEQAAPHDLDLRDSRDG